MTPLNRIIIFVANVQVCSEFYRTMFGFQIAPGCQASDDWIELETGGCLLAFHRAYGPDGPMQQPTGSEEHPHKIVFQTDDVPAKVAELKAKGVRMGDIKTFGPTTMCDGRDVEGHVFQISKQ